MTNYLDPDQDDWTVKELLEMSEEEFLEAACEDLTFTANWNGPFQTKEVIHRTLAALRNRASFTDSLLSKPIVERREATESFRRHVQSVIDNTKLRIGKMENSARKYERIWKRIANDLCDELEESDRSWMLDEINLGDYFETTPGMKITLREWVEARREKDPSRVPAWTEAA